MTDSGQAAEECTAVDRNIQLAGPVTISDEVTPIDGLRVGARSSINQRK